MPKIRMWSPYKRNDYDYFDKIILEQFYMGGTGVYIHKYLEPKNNNPENPSIGNEELKIDDVLFLENKFRKYDDTIYEMRCHYNPQDSEFDLSQFGIFLTNDVIILTFHINDTVEKIGRKLLSGDVLELPHLRDDLILNKDMPALNRFYVVDDVSYYSKGYDANWWPHILRVKAKKLVYSEMFEDIFKDYKDPLSDNSCETDLTEILSNKCVSESINDAINDEAALNVKWDPKYYESSHLWVQMDENNIPILCWYSSNATPPNGEPLYGEGESFPEDIPDGAYFLRTDFKPNRLFKRSGTRFVKIGDDLRKPWLPGHQVTDSFINNDNTFKNDMGETEEERQALSKVVKPRNNQ